ncbi:hypothetical protein Gotur_026887 [Gossypium turneri]
MDIENGRTVKPKTLWATIKGRFTITYGVNMQEFKRTAKCIVLKYLSKRFSIKVTIIEKAKNLESLAIDELIGSLQTLEMNLEGAKRTKTKGDKNNAFQRGRGVPSSENAAIEKL